MVLLTFVWKCFQDRNFHGVVVGLYEQSIEFWIGLVACVLTETLQNFSTFCHFSFEGHRAGGGGL